MKPNNHASKRTKERFKQHSPFLVIRQEPCQALGNRNAVLLRSQRTDWFGWIPTEELEYDPQTQAAS